MNDHWEALLDIAEDIKKAAKSIQSEWSDVVEDWEDLAGDIQLKLVSENQASKVAALELESRRKVLKKVARQIASDMRDQYEHFSGNFRYSTDEVRNLLNRGALAFVAQDIVDRDGNLPDEWADTASDWEKVEAKKRVKVSVDSMDLRVHFEKLENHHKIILIRKYIGDETLNNAERRSLSEAATALTKLLNRGHRTAVANHEGPGSRRALSNSQAQALTKNQEELG